MDLTTQIVWLFVLAIPIASISWTITHEEIFRESRDYCLHMSQRSGRMVIRKFFYLFTCEFCFSHYITVLMLGLTRYKLLLNDWRGYVIAGFALVWIANFYMSLFASIKVDIKKRRVRTKIDEKKIEP